MGKSLSLEHVRHELVESAGQDMQQGDANNAKYFARRDGIFGIGQMKYESG